MKKIFPYTTIIAATLSITDCNPIEIDADLPDRGGMITIASLFAADSVWGVDVDSSKSILDTKLFTGTGETDIGPITNAQVTIREDGQLHDNLVYSPRKFITVTWSYRSSSPEIRPTGGKTYDIEVTVPGRGVASSTCFVPSPVQVSSVKAKAEMTQIKTVGILGDKAHTYYLAVPVEVVIDDPDGENFYEIFVRHKGSGIFYWATPTFTRDLRFHNTGLSPSIHVTSSQDSQQYSVIFSDQNMQAQQMKLTIMMPVEAYYLDGKYEMRADVGYTMVLRTLSKEYFQYIASQELQAYSSDDPFAQPVVVYGNIKGGLGIFAGFSEYAAEVEFH